MKRTYTALLLGLLLFVGCSSEETLESMKAKLIELETARDKLDDEIKELKTKIATAEGDSTDVKLKKVTVAKVEQGTFTRYIEVQGVVESDENVMISPELGGLVTEIKVKEGQKVKADQELIVLDADAINKQIAEINTALDLAITVFNKQQALWDKKIGTELQYLQAKNNKESLESKLATAQSQLSKAMIKAPISGIVDRIIINEGEMASPGRPVLRIVNLSQIKLKAEVSERYVTAFKQGDKVTVHFPSLDLEKEATLTLIGQVIDPTNRTFTIQASIPNDNEQLKANLLGTIRFVDHEEENALIIPSKLIQQSRDQRFVYVTEENEEGATVAVKKMIEVGKSFRGQTTVSGGLAVTDVLIDDGSKTVKEGQEITVLPN